MNDLIQPIDLKALHQEIADALKECSDPREHGDEIQLADDLTSALQGSRVWRYDALSSDAAEALWDAVGAASRDMPPDAPLRRFYLMLDMMLAIERSQ